MTEPTALNIRKRGSPPNCHPTRKHRAKGLCTNCYTKQYLDANPHIRKANLQRQLASEHARPEVARRKRDFNLRKKYGISCDDYDNMVTKQEGRCALCRDESDKLVIDHCHISGTVRKLLCQRCNTIVGMYEQRPELWPLFVLYANDELDEAGSVCAGTTNPK